MSNSNRVRQAEDVVRSYLASFASADPELIAAHVSEDFVNEHTAALGTGCVGKSEYLARLPGFLGDMTNLAYQLDHLVAAASNRDDMADAAITLAAFYTMTASWQAETSISLPGVQRLVVLDDLIIHRTDYWDSANFLVQADPDAAKALAAFGVTSRGATN